MTDRYRSVLAAFHATPLAILPAKMREIQAMLYARAAGVQATEEQLREVAAARREGGVKMAGRLAVVPVFGTLAQRVGAMEEASGGISTEQLGASLESLAADRAVKAIVMVFDSPGGSVAGTPELADRVGRLGAQKKIVGIADGMAASAAYWILSQCREVNVSPSGQVGSIGVLCAHEDHSKADETAGVKTTYVTSAKYKVEGNPGEPLGEEALGEMQAKVDAYHAMFVKAVARGRGVTEARVNADYGQGRMLLAKEAVARGMVDRVATLEQVLSRLGAEAGDSGVAAAIADAKVRAMMMGD